MSKEDENKLESINKTLYEILKWTRFANIAKLKEIFQVELDSNEKKLAFENSDGVNGLKELSTISGAPRDTIYGWWQKWSRLGLVTESEIRKGRMIKIISLDDVGIKVLKRKITSPSPQTISEPTQVEGEKSENI